MITEFRLGDRRTNYCNKCLKLLKIRSQAAYSKENGCNIGESLSFSCKILVLLQIFSYFFSGLVGADLGQLERNPPYFLRFRNLKDR